MTTETFSPLLFVNECLLDRQRTEALRAAIRRQVRPGDVVLDAGTGTGILALFAAEAGARQVYAVDVSPDALDLARRGIAQQRSRANIELIEADLTQLRLPEPVDVVIMEMLDTGLITEPQAPALNALRRHGVIGPATRVVPERVRCTLELVDYDFTFYGFELPLILQARNAGVQARIRRVFSETAVYADVDCRADIPLEVHRRLPLTMRADGTVNAVRLRTQTVLADDVSLWETSDMNMPVIVPVGPLAVAAGQPVAVAIRYTMGAGYRTLELCADTAVPVPQRTNGTLQGVV